MFVFFYFKQLFSGHPVRKLKFQYLGISYKMEFISHAIYQNLFQWEFSVFHSNQCNNDI